MEQVEYIIKRLDALSCPPITVVKALSAEKEDLSYKILKENPKITLEEFLEKVGLTAE